MNNDDKQMISKEIMKRVLRKHPKVLEDAESEEGRKSIHKAIESCYTIVLVSKACLFGGIWLLLSYYDKQLAELFIAVVALVQMKFMTDHRFEGLEDNVLEAIEDVKAELPLEETKKEENTTKETEELDASVVENEPKSKEDSEKHDVSENKEKDS